MYKLRDAGFSPDHLVDFSVSTDMKNSSRRVMSVDQPRLGMSREYLMKGPNDPYVQANREYIKDVAILLGATPATIDQEVDQIIKFQIRLASITQPREARRDASKLYNPMTISQLARYDQIHLSHHTSIAQTGPKHPLAAVHQHPTEVHHTGGTSDHTFYNTFFPRFLQKKG